MKKQELTQILGFLHLMGKVKGIIRYKGMPGWKGARIKRWDSVAEHSWRFALMAFFLYPYLKEKVNLEKTLKMILVHDIIELSAQDYSPVAKHGGVEAMPLATKPMQQNSREKKQRQRQFFLRSQED